MSKKYKLHDPTRNHSFVDNGWQVVPEYWQLANSKRVFRHVRFEENTVVCTLMSREYLFQREELIPYKDERKYKEN